MATTPNETLKMAWALGIQLEARHPDPKKGARNWFLMDNTFGDALPNSFERWIAAGWKFRLPPSNRL